MGWERSDRPDHPKPTTASDGKLLEQLNDDGDYLNALKAENITLRAEVDSLKDENESLRLEIKVMRNDHKQAIQMAGFDLDDAKRRYRESMDKIGNSALHQKIKLEGEVERLKTAIREALDHASSGSYTEQILRKAVGQ